MLPKPQLCDQNWLAMPPTARGRLCGQCEREIYDFSALSWPQIVQTQAAHGNRLCGLYSDAQLAHWGHVPPRACAPLAAATALALALAAVPAPAQTLSPATPGPAAIHLRGTVTMVSAQTGKPEPVPGVTVLLLGSTLGTSTDMQGHYALTVPIAERADTVRLGFSALGFVTQHVPLPLTPTGVVEQNAQLVLDAREVQAFYVRKPSLLTRVQWRFQRWFTPAD
ncbi:carboxypeptidase-like regulatory domain-containing protein [Hymenobacter sp. UV11]|uniref:carboxypeptidase-like regulatory domain-containing protein n=1 Tax=Hymenobacter sp. UV11 TaxID=1849735 RepID=UPI00105CC993|nr:carboxypeptidase-like regulatory domain-containing protein [Hymenobacter sp. UV11]TDN38668.1 hypothetical protein A8B98_22805 [Hymenobacter sp. UV11]TFZ63581.1 carboxypeptidase-like regulatory domain-containing protein [Hymenobacter sp. UV11]